MISTKDTKKVLFVLHNSDISYLTASAGVLNKYISQRHVLTRKVETASEIFAEARAKKCYFIATTSISTFKLFDCTLAGTESNNVGSVIEAVDRLGKLFRIILLPRLKAIYTQNAGKFLLGHYVNKLVNGGILKKDKFSWEFVTPANLEHFVQELDSALLCGVDIETSKQDLKITSVAYCYMRPDKSTHSIVVTCNAAEYPFCISAMRRLNNTACRKVMQNGRYDASYFIRFNAPLRNWLFDTYHMMHAIFSELPRDLAFISSFFLDNFKYWKEESATNLYEYNAKDSHNTLWVFLAMIKYTDSSGYSYAIKNYLSLFPMVFPMLHCSLDGMIVDEAEMNALREAEEVKRDEYKRKINILLGEENFNPSSPKQVLEMFRAMGYTRAKSSDVKELRRFGETSSIYQRLVDNITGYRKAVKAIGTYFSLKLLNGRLMYSLDPSGTDTGRTASKESNFWCGTQIQNIPMYGRGMVKAEPGWLFGAVDKAQSESYCTGYLSQDLTLIKTLLTCPDFHCGNASLFFGIPFEELYDEATGTVLQPALRKLSKPVNHGANYNMQAATLLETMGTKRVIEAKRLLRLPETMPLLKVCEYLLYRFDATYTRVRSTWYRELVQEVLRSGKLTIPEIGYTRRTFLQPNKSKLDLNALVSHKPQCLSVLLVNRAFKRVWYELQIKKYSGKFRLKAQVHDEILFTTKAATHKQILAEVADIMDDVAKIKINGRLMQIPSTTAGGKTWADCKD